MKYIHHALKIFVLFFAVSRVDLEPSIRFRSLKIVEQLLEAGANPQLGDKEGYTPLDVARHFEIDGMIKLFEKAITSSSDA